MEPKLLLVVSITITTNLACTTALFVANSYFLQRPNLIPGVAGLALMTQSIWNTLGWNLMKVTVCAVPKYAAKIVTLT